jgi:sulfur-oxidizing protein SoxA
VRRAALALLLLTAAAPRSGHDDASRSIQAMQDDDTANPGLLWVAQGEALWDAPAGTGPSCASCHGAISSMRGVAARYPAWDAPQRRALSLWQRIDHCRTTHQGAAALDVESDAMLSLTAALGRQSRGMDVAVATGGKMAEVIETGRRLHQTRQGQLNLSCAQCHDDLAGRHLAGSLIPQGHGNGYPEYRLEWQTLGSLWRRVRNCLTGVRAAAYAPDSAEMVAIEAYLAERARGLIVETPAVRP